MLLTCLRAVEFILLSFFPSLISSFLISGPLETMANAVSLGLFLLLAAGIVFLGYRFMSAIGNKRAYLQVTGIAYAVFVAFALAIFVAMGEEGCELLMNGLLLFGVFGVEAGISVFFSLILLFICVMIPGYVFEKKADFYTVMFKNIYRDAAFRYRPAHSHTAHSRESAHKIVANKVQNNQSEASPTPEELQRWKEHEKRRHEYEQRFTSVKPAKFTQSKREETEEEIIERKALEKEARLQQYFIDGSKRKEHPAVDKGAELKKAHELARAMNEREYHSNYRRHSHHETKTVDKEAELKKARELKQQLEYEETQRMKELFGRK